MRKSNTDISYLCDLAKLQLSTDEQAAFQADLDAALTLLEQLKTIDTRQTAPYKPPAASTVSPPDCPYRQDRVSEAGKAVRAARYIVPSVIE